MFQNESWFTLIFTSNSVKIFVALLSKTWKTTKVLTISSWYRLETGNALNGVYHLFDCKTNYKKEKFGKHQSTCPAHFILNLRYAPLTCHEREECSRKDDVESWFYQQLELTKAGIPWRNLANMVEIGQLVLLLAAITGNSKKITKK